MYKSNNRAKISNKIKPSNLLNLKELLDQGWREKEAGFEKNLYCVSI